MSPHDDEVGSLAEEAAKLLDALQGWATEAGPGMGAGLQAAREHLAAGGTECTYCPVCQAVRLVRQTSPEVRAHLGAAAGSLLQAAAGLLATQVPTDPPRPSGVQHIDLAGDDDADAAWEDGSS